MKKVKQRPRESFLRTIGYFLAGAFFGLSILVAVARLTWHSNYYPGVVVGNVPVGGLTREAALTKVHSAITDYSVMLTHGEDSWVVPSEARTLIEDTVLTEAYRYGRRLKPLDYWGLLWGTQVQYPLQLSSSAIESFDSWLAEVVPSVESPAESPTVELIKQKIVVTNGSDGREIDRTTLHDRLRAQAGVLDSRPIAVPTKTITKTLSEEELSALQTRGEKLLTSSLTLTFEDERIVLHTKDLLPFLSTSPGEAVIDEASVKSYVAALSEGLNRPAQNAKFVFENGAVSEFAPGKDGVEIQIDESAKLVVAAVTKLLGEEVKTETVMITANRTSPQVTTDKVNDLGIKERIGRGESYYAHSIANRVYNVGLAAARTQSALIAPGEEYSFNREVGEISGATGYKTAYVISGGRTVLGDGGGVCQVSTTLFRAAMNAGLPIVERWAHAYRVGYYEQNSKPGIDATVYSPSKDFRFKNDTPGHILIQTINDPKTLHLVVEIYGTSDGRTSSVSEPKVWGIAPPPPDIYQDDPSLPNGTVRQVDWSAWGAKTSFEYKVVRNGETIQEKTYTSSYRPWQNVYLRGTGQ